MDNKKKWKRIFFLVPLFLLFLFLAEWFVNGKEEEPQNKKPPFDWTELWLGEVLDTWMPSFSFYEKDNGQEGLFSMVLRQNPFYAYQEDQGKGELQQESGSIYEEIIKNEANDEYTSHIEGDDLRTPETSKGRIVVDESMQEQLQKENAVPETTGEETVSENSGQESSQEESDSSYRAPQTKSQEYSWDYYQDFDALVKEFYAIDPTTTTDETQLNLDALLTKDFSIEKNTEEPQILIYHTHSQEAFADSEPGNASHTIMGVGEVLAEILRNQYGYNVMHHMGQYDVEGRDYAYSNSLPEIEKLLEENPSIEVVIDLHRDAMAEGQKLVVDLDGKPTAMFMFFNGLSRTKKYGDIDYLPNPNIADNLAFSFQMQVLCNEYYPGLTRRIYLKGYRYNMHLKARYLLVEMGAQTNTVEEMYNACGPLAHVLDMELSGVDFGYSSP